MFKTREHWGTIPPTKSGCTTQLIRSASHASTSGPPYKTIVSLTSTSFPLSCRGVDSRTILKPPTCISDYPAATIASVPAPNGGL
jgi:hypothetical protein